MANLIQTPSLNKPVEGIDHTTDQRPFSIHYTWVTLDPALYLHCHPEIELFYLISGELNFFIEDQVFHLSAGEAVLIPPGLLHHATRTPKSIASGVRCDFYAMVFSPDMLMDFIPSYCERYLLPIGYHPDGCALKIVTDTDWGCQCLECLRSIFSKYNSDIKETELFIRGNLLIIWQLLYNNHMHALMKSYKNAPIEPFMKKCVDFINTNYMLPLTLKELASVAGLSTGHLCRQFKEYTGYSPFTYLNKKRIAESCLLLVQTGKKIADIASLCGFNNISYYNRAFVKIMGETPSSYRKNYRG